MIHRNNNLQYTIKINRPHITYQYVLTKKKKTRKDTIIMTIIIDRNISEEELEKNVKEFEEQIMTDKEEKQLEEDIRNGIMPGEILPDGTAQLLPR